MSSTGSCKSLVLLGSGGFDQFQVQSKPIPEAQKGQVVINIRAAGVNFSTLMTRQGGYDKSQTYPTVLGSEGAGEVIKVGAEVTGVKVGDRVICTVPNGMWSEYTSVAENRCFVMPDSMTYEEGGALFVNYVTAYHMLFDLANLRKRKSVLIHMVAGGVGNAAVQLCRTVPGVTIFGTCSLSKHAVMKEAGVDHVIDYNTQDYAQEIRKLSPKRVDIVLDPLSGPDSVRGYELLKPLGTIVHFGAANMVTSESRNLWQMAKTWWSTQSYSPLSMMSNNKCAAGYHMGHLKGFPDTARPALQHIFEMYKDGQIKPVIDSVWPLEDIDKAMTRMHERKNIGKVLLCPQKKAGEGEIKSLLK